MVAPGLAQTCRFLCLPCCGHVPLGGGTESHDPVTSLVACAQSTFLCPLILALAHIRGLTRVSQVGAVWACILLGCVYSLSFPFSPVLYIGEGGAGESLPPLARPCAAPEHRLAVSWCCHLLALGRSSVSLSCLPVVLGLGGTEKVSQLFPRGEDVRLGPAFGLWRLEAPG